MLEPGRLAGPAFERLPAPPRRWPVRVGTARRLEIAVALELPPGLEPEGIPAPASLATAMVSGTARWAFEDGRLTYYRQVDLAGGTVAPEEYASFREALRAVEAWDTTGVVLVRR